MRAFGRVSGFYLLGILAGAAGVFAGLASPALAQAPTRGQPGVVDRPIRTPPAELKRKPVEIERLTPQREAVPRADEVVATITKINFKGMQVVAESDLQAIGAKYLNRPITRGEMAQLKFDVVRHYYDRGFILVRAVTPPQDLSDGVLDLVIYEAKVGKITVRNDDVLQAWVVEALTSTVESGDVFHERKIESMVNDFNDFNNIDASLNLRQGKALGTTDLVLSVVRTDEDIQSISYDNYGSQVTGDRVATVNLEKSNLLGMGEKFDLDATISQDETYSFTGTFKIPVGFRNIMFDARALRSQVELGNRDSINLIESDGDTEVFEVALSSRLINMRRQILQVRTGFQAREHQSNATTNPNAGTTTIDDNIRQAFLETSYLVRFPDLFAFGSLRLAKGVDLFGAAEMNEADATVADGDPDVFLIQPLVFASYRPIEDAELRFTASGQIASNRVLSSDLFTLGGYGSVRGFEPGETTGEAGIQFSLEYSHTVFEGEYLGADWKAGVGPFIDGGHVFPRTHDFGGDSTLLSTGIGLEIETGASKIGRTTLRVDWAYPIGGYVSTEVESNTFYARLTQTVAF